MTQPRAAKKARKERLCNRKKQLNKKNAESETISFVIKGKLTPIKPALITRKKAACRKDIAKKRTPKLASDRKREESPKKATVVKKEIVIKQEVNDDGLVMPEIKREPVDVTVESPKQKKLKLKEIKSEPVDFDRNFEIHQKTPSRRIANTKIVPNKKTSPAAKLKLKMAQKITAKTNKKTIIKKVTTTTNKPKPKQVKTNTQQIKKDLINKKDEAKKVDVNLKTDLPAECEEKPSSKKISSSEVSKPKKADVKKDESKLKLKESKKREEIQDSSKKTVQSKDSSIKSKKDTSCEKLATEQKKKEPQKQDSSDVKPSTKNTRKDTSEQKPKKDVQPKIKKDAAKKESDKTKKDDEEKLKKSYEKMLKDDEKLKKEEERLRKTDERLQKEEERWKKEGERLKALEEKLDKEEERLKKEEERLKKDEDKLKKEAERLGKEEDKLKKDEQPTKKEDKANKDKKQQNNDDDEEPAKSKLEIVVQKKETTANKLEEVRGKLTKNASKKTENVHKKFEISIKKDENVQKQKDAVQKREELRIKKEESQQKKNDLKKKIDEMREKLNLPSNKEEQINKQTQEVEGEGNKSHIEDIIAELEETIWKDEKEAKDAQLMRKPKTTQINNNLLKKPNMPSAKCTANNKISLSVVNANTNTNTNTSLSAAAAATTTTTNQVKVEEAVEEMKKPSKKPVKRKIRSESSISTDDTCTSDELISLDVLRQKNTQNEDKDKVCIKTEIQSDVSVKEEEEQAEQVDEEAVKVEVEAEVEAEVESEDDGEQSEDNTRKTTKQANKRRKVLTSKKAKRSSKDQRSRKLKLYGFWNGPKRHRVASLNALAKVHCLYENEGRAMMLDGPDISSSKKSSSTSSSSSTKDIKIEKDDDKSDDPAPTRTLRSVPGLRAVGKHWDMHDTTSSSSEEDSGDNYQIKSVRRPKPKQNTASKLAVKIKEEDEKKDDEEEESDDEKDTEKEKEKEKKPKMRRKRKRAELIMDLKDMVVRKRMASLNASAILAASYAYDKRTVRSPRTEESEESDDSDESYIHEPDRKKFVEEDSSTKEEDRSLIEVRASPNKKMAVIVNQDTDVTITGVYVNSTTRSTHHEGFCSIQGMQYRISATSHTQTNATAVSTETILQSSNSSQDNSNGESTPSKSYTPLDALSSMQPPNGSAGPHGVGIPPHHLQPAPHHHSQLSPLGRRHGCSSAFSAPPGHYAPPGIHPAEQGPYMHGYYQPAGPLITVPHGHTQPLPKAPLPEESPNTRTPPVHQPPPPSSAGDSSDSEVIITSVTTAKEATPPSSQGGGQPPPSQSYRYGGPVSSSGYPYYPHQYYPGPNYGHHDLCYPNPYLHHKPMHPTYRRYLPQFPGGQYYPPPNAPDLYERPPPPPPPAQSSQQVVTASPAASGSSYQSSGSGPPPPTLIETYPPPPPPTLLDSYPPPPPHYYPGYGAPPSCYTHSPPSRQLPFINPATYQSCPCPMQSCPKNGLTGPLTGDSKRSAITSLSKESVPLPPVALALPLEPASATGPPSPARGSAGMPPPPSPAGATYQPPTTPKQEAAEINNKEDNCEKRKKARVGKAMVRNAIIGIQPQQTTNTMLLMCNPPHPTTTTNCDIKTQSQVFETCVKREVESPKEPEEQKKEPLTPEPDPSPEPCLLELEKPISTSPIPEHKDTLEEISNQPLKCEESEIEAVSENKAKAEETPSPESTTEIVEVTNTVAENVKVKNMKRKLSIVKESPELTTDEKKIKTENNLTSYKNLIKKSTTCIKINNGRRKLNTDLRLAAAAAKLRRTMNKRKNHSSLKEASEGKKSKINQSNKPLTANNFNNNSKLNASIKQNKLKNLDKDSENKKPLNKKQSNKSSGKKISSSTTTTNNNNNNKRSSSIERTIESVISEAVKCGDNNKNTRTPIEKCDNVIQTKRKSLSTTINSKKRTKRQSVCEAPLMPYVKPRWSNGWNFVGQPFEAKIFKNNDESIVVKNCYLSMRHDEGDIIEVRDCVLLRAGTKKNELPFVAKIASLWEDPDNGEMMMSLLWYYRPEHTDQGRQASDRPDEVFASKHKDVNSVACIEDKCYVLTYSEYCRYRKNRRRLEEGIEDAGPCIPVLNSNPRLNRQPPLDQVTSSELVFFCRRVYDFRQKRIVKHPLTH